MTAESRMAAVWLEDGRVSVREVPVPRPAPGEALVRVRLAGICNTDLELLRGYYPFTGILGHEFVGVVEDAPGAPAWIGRRVVGEINAACGTCSTCRAGRASHCPARTVLGIKARHGAFATFLTLPAGNLHAVPDYLDDDVAVFTEPVAAALEVLEQVRIGAGHRVVVVGAGKLGHLVAQALAATGCRLTVIGRSRRPLDLLAARGIETAAAAQVPDATADVVVECSGDPAGLAVARTLVRPRGTIVLKSTYRGETTVNLSAVVVDEVTLVGSRCGPFGKALAALEAGTIDPRALVDARVPLAEGAAALTRAAAPGTMKMLIDA